MSVVQNIDPYSVWSTHHVLDDGSIDTGFDTSTLAVTGHLSSDAVVGAWNVDSRVAGQSLDGISWWLSAGVDTLVRVATTSSDDS